MYLQSGVCKMFRSVDTSDLISVNIGCVWPFDPAYDSFPVEPIDWYNASFDVATELGADDAETAAIARDLHFQLLHHMYHAAAKKQKGKEILHHLGAMYVLPQYRSNLVAKVSGALLAKKPDNVFMGMVVGISHNCMSTIEHIKAIS